MEVEADFADFVASRQRTLLRTAWLLTGDWALAEDLVQTALAAAWPRWSGIAGDTPDAYVRRVMINTALGWRRRRWTAEVATGAPPDPKSAVYDQRTETRIVLVQAIRSLPPRQRAVIALRFFDDMTEAQTAGILGCSVGTVKSQTFKALATLRKQPALSDLTTVGSQND